MRSGLFYERRPMNLRLNDQGFALKITLEELAGLQQGTDLSVAVSTNPAVAVTVRQGTETGFSWGKDGITIMLTATDLDDLQALGTSKDGILLSGEGWQLRLQIDLRSSMRAGRGQARMAGGRDKGLGFRRSAGGVSPTAPRSRR